jgi:preprotein translocase subunit SecF
MPGEHHLLEKFKEFYKHHYKQFFIVPVLTVIFCLVVLGMHYAKTGEIVERGIDMRGGVVATIDWRASTEPDLSRLQKEILANTGAQGLRIVRVDSFIGAQRKLAGLNIEAGPEVNATNFRDNVFAAFANQGFEIKQADYNLKIVGPAVGAAFLQTTYTAIALGFLMLGIVIYFIFKTPPAIATVISCIFFDFLGALAVMNIFSIPLSPPTLAALLMLIGFSIDSDILITNAVLRRHDGTVMDRAFHSMKTGLTMILAATGALLALWALSGTSILKDMTVILIGGLVFDVIHTWFTNHGVLLLVAEKKAGGT